VDEQGVDSVVRWGRRQPTRRASRRCGAVLRRCASSSSVGPGALGQLTRLLPACAFYAGQTRQWPITPAVTSGRRFVDAQPEPCFCPRQCRAAGTSRAPPARRACSARWRRAGGCRCRACCRQCSLDPAFALKGLPGRNKGGSLSARVQAAVAPCPCPHPRPAPCPPPPPPPSLSSLPAPPAAPPPALHQAGWRSAGRRSGSTASRRGWWCLMAAATPWDPAPSVGGGRCRQKHGRACSWPLAASLASGTCPLAGTLLTPRHPPSLCGRLASGAAPASGGGLRRRRSGRRRCGAGSSTCGALRDRLA
jgi:hypothetical protein